MKRTFQLKTFQLIVSRKGKTVDIHSMQAELDMVCVCGSKLPSSRVERIRVRSSRPDCKRVPMHFRKVALEILLGAFSALEIPSPCQDWAVGGSSLL